MCYNFLQTTQTIGNNMKKWLYYMYQ